MIRSLVAAFVTIAVVVVFAPFERLSAQAQGKPVPNNVPVAFSGGTPGLNLELFINNGKVAETTVSPEGTASSILDFSNLGKVQAHIYVDECQDGKTVKVMVAPGQVAEDNGCKRRFAGAGWWTNCGVTRITIDLRNFGAHVVGCGNFFTTPTGYITTGGAVVGGLLISTLGGGDSTDTFTNTPIFTARNTTSTTTVTPTTPTTPTTTAPPSTQPTQPTTPFDFTMAYSGGSWEHTNPGVSSDACGRFTTTPALANAPFTVTTTGPGVLQATITAVTNGSGIGLFRVRINQFGTYGFNVSLTSQSVTKTLSGSVNVTSANNTCPSS